MQRIGSQIRGSGRLPDCSVTSPRSTCPPAWSGLHVVRDILPDVEDVHFAQLSSADVVRHRLVAAIVDAFARWDAAGERPNLRAAAPRNGPPPDRRARRR